MTTSHQTAEDRMNQHHFGNNNNNNNSSSSSSSSSSSRTTNNNNNMTIVSNAPPPSAAAAPVSEDATSTVSTDSTTNTTTTTTTTTASVVEAAATSKTAMLPSQQKVATTPAVSHPLCTTTTTTTTTAAAAAAAAACRRLQGHVCVCEGCESTRSEMLGSDSVQQNNKRARLLHNNDDDDDDDTDTRLQTIQQKQQQREQKDKVDKMSVACRTILECMGEDPTREGLVKTPERWAKALLFMSSGYPISPEQVTNGAVFCENHHEMVVVRNIDIHSLCEHHMLPFTGRVHIGYIPNGKVIGLSKLARIAELYARRLQVQERLTSQIADAILETVHPLGVAVVVECTHFCMVMRGVQKTGAVTTTSSVRGCFETNSKTRAEFFSILHGSTRIEMH